MTEQNRTEFKENLKQLVNTTAKVVGELGAEIASSAEKLVEDAKILKRQLVISVRLDETSVHRIEQLIDAGLCKTRSEAVAFLTREGIKARDDLFRKIEEKIAEIRRIKDDLKKDFTS